MWQPKHPASDAVATFGFAIFFSLLTLLFLALSVLVLMALGGALFYL
jgi:hypothetical protein